MSNSYFEALKSLINGTQDSEFITGMADEVDDHIQEESNDDHTNI
jgi:hypothetical protein